MDDLKTKTTYDQADELYQNAQEEYSRPEEDVVPYSVCRGAYKAVNKYLTGYLMKNGMDVHASMSLETLLSHCKEINNEFHNLNLDLMYNTEDQENVFMDVKTVRRYLSLADQTRQLVGDA